MFKFLAHKKDDPGFPDAVILTNKSEHWLELDNDGRRLPPKSHVAMSQSMVANSAQIHDHVNTGVLIVSSGAIPAQQVKPKRRKKHEEPEEPKSEGTEPTEQEVSHLPQAEPTPHDSEPAELTTLVAEPIEENWVSSTENIVGEPTPDHI